MAPQILVADDEPDVVALLAGNLQAAGFRVIKAFDGSNALAAAKRYLPTAALLDGRMPGMTGLEVCRAMKSDARTAGIPVLVLSGQDSEIERIVAFEVGVDDYIAKPFSPREVILRIRAIVRRVYVAMEERPAERVGEITLDHARHEVTVSGVPVQLTAIEYKLLCSLAERVEEVLTREALLMAVWGSDCEVGRRTIDTHLRRLRDKLRNAAGQITTVRGMGYGLSAKGDS